MAMDDHFLRQTQAVIPIADLKFERLENEFDNREDSSKLIDFIEHQKTIIDMIKVQCALIQVQTSAQGTQSFDLPLNLKKQRNADKARKDSYSALVLGNYMMNLFYDMMEAPQDNTVQTFTPMFIG